MCGMMCGKEKQGKTRKSKMDVKETVKLVKEQ